MSIEGACPWLSYVIRGWVGEGKKREERRGWGGERWTERGGGGRMRGGGEAEDGMMRIIIRGGTDPNFQSEYRGVK